MTLRRLLLTCGGGLVGAVAGYMIGVGIGCDWLYPDSNLCGIYGALVSGPVGLVLGVILVWRSTGAAR
jgi:hypothetical protein